MSDERPQSSDQEGLDRQVSRRTLLVSGATGAAALAGLSASGAAARGFASRALDSVSADSVTLASYEENAGIPALAADTKLFTKKYGIDVKTHTFAHGPFQEQINSYLQGHPDDVFTWFAGYRMQFFAAKGLATPIDDVWKVIAPQYAPAFKAAATGLDGHQYLVPTKNYPWAVHYRKSLWKEKGYTAPKTWAQFIALAKKMQADGLTPIALTDKDGWPPMGWFDIINMRMNGYQFHVRLMAGKLAWDTPQVKAVFNKWAELFPYYSEGILGLTWQDGAAQLENKQTGMFFLGSFLTGAMKPANAKDVDLFPFPMINPKWGQDSIDAPIDGNMLSKKPKNIDAAKKLVAFLGSAPALNAYLKINSGNLGTNKHTNTSAYTPLQRKGARLIASTKHIAQYMDRDTRPDFASTVMIPSLQSFISNPGSVDSLVKSIQKQKVAIFVS